MNWMHKISREWFEARQEFLTASEVRKLIPVTATGRPRTKMADAFLKVWSDKMRIISDDDLISYGAAARGHLLEKYALIEFNKLEVMPELYHWDDTLVFNKEFIAVSPDALDIPLPEDGRVAVTDTGAVHLGEVKSYDSEKHYACGMGDKMQLEERWQVATAFHAIPTLEQAALIFFNPSAVHPVFYHLYTRAELAEELKMIAEVKKDYDFYAEQFLGLAYELCPEFVREQCRSEEEIQQEILDEQVGEVLNDTV